jgi:hypothetical protein
MAEACGKHMNEPPPRARTIAGDVPIALETLLDRLLAKSPAARGSAGDVIRALDSLVTGTANTIDSQRTQATALPPPTPAAKRSRTPLVIGLLLCVLVAGGFAAALLSNGSKAAAPPSPPQGMRPPTRPIDAPMTPARAEFLTWLESENQWFTDGDVPAQYFAVRRHEYLRYLETLDEPRRTWATPLYRAAIDGDTAPINWITYEQAEAYCQAIGARLPVREEWERMDAARTGINAGGLRIWTRSKNEKGQAMVRGAFAEMQPAEIEKERASGFTQWKDTEATAGGREPKDKVASRQIGVRCVR